MNVSRRKFLKDSAGLATLSTLAPSLPDAVVTQSAPPQSAGLGFERTSDRIRISGQNGISLELVVQGNKLKGIGSVSFHGKPLRSANECIWPEMATPYGAEVVHLELDSVRQENGAVIVSGRPFYRIIHRMEWTEHAMHPLINTTTWSKEPFHSEGSRFDWIINQVDETYDGSNYAGFSYSYHYHSPGYPIYQIEDKATWELGGNVVGNGFILRGGISPTRDSRKTPHSIPAGTSQASPILTSSNTSRSTRNCRVSLFNTIPSMCFSWFTNILRMSGLCINASPANPSCCTSISFVST